MREENQVAIEHRFLAVVTRFSSQRFELERVAALEWCAAHDDRLTSPNRIALEALRDCSLSKRTLALLLYGCYADIPANRQFGAVFDLASPHIGARTNARLRFAVFNRRLPVLSLDHGHHFLAIFDFSDGAPDLVDALPVDSLDGGVTKPSIGMCDEDVWLAARGQ